ncbi:hypothetical protein D9M71_380500 [compost metagenome]
MVPDQGGSKSEQGEEECERAGIETHYDHDGDEELHDDGNDRGKHRRGRTERFQIAHSARKARQLAPAGNDEQDHQQDASQQEDLALLIIEQGISHGGLPSF